MTEFSPREIVSELDRFIVGQNDAKRAVAIALRNRWRRLRVADDLREEILPKNILMIGPTGVGKTEIARRLAKLANAPFLKVEATKFTEVGYVGRDVDQIVRDLLDIGMTMTRESMREQVKTKAEARAEERVLEALVGASAGAETKAKFPQDAARGPACRPRDRRRGPGHRRLPAADHGDPGHAGRRHGHGQSAGHAGQGVRRPRQDPPAERGRKLRSADGRGERQAARPDKVTREAIRVVEQNGIVFLDEIDKICARSERIGGDVSREGVQRDLLPLIEGTTVSTKHGTVRTDHILFIASGAFHLAKPSDLLPELQGRLPIRVELKPLTQADFRRILTEPQASLIRQYKALLATEGVTLDFTEDAIDALAELAAQINGSVENIGARRLHTVMERLLEEISFTAPDRSGSTRTIDAAYVNAQVAALAKDTDLSKFIL